jgi:hypothetical protein
MNLKTGSQPRSNFVKDENGDLLADSHNILGKWGKEIFLSLECTRAVCKVRGLTLSLRVGTLWR